MVQVVMSKPLGLCWFICVYSLSTVAVYGLVDGSQYYPGNQCSPGEMTAGIPSEPLKLDGLQYLGRRTSIEKIVVECCQLGSEKCQYLWIYGDDCYAVSCTTTPQACEPTHQQRDQATTTSIYVKIEHNSNILKEWNTFIDRNDISNEADKHPTRPNPPPATPLIPSPATPLTPSPAIPPNAPPTTPPNAPPATPPSTPPATPSNAPPPSSDVPPVADAGPDRTIRLPENSVTLLGDKSYDDKGITFFLWKLVSTDMVVPPTLIDRTLPLLHVINLTPGDYNFILTVTDSAHQVDSDTVQVHVLPEVSNSTSNPGLSTLSPTPNLPEPPNDKEPEPPTNSETGPPEDSDFGNSNSSGGTNSSSGAIVEGEDKELYSKKHNLLRVIVPTLLCVGVILILSAVMVGTGICLCRNKRRMKHLYRYKRLPETIEKT